jgi:hypothetical protein
VLTAREIVRSVYGVWRLARADPGGMAYFDATEEGFWRSFRVAILVAPAYALLVLLDYALPPPNPDAVPVVVSGTRVVAVELIAYAIGWMAFPLAAHYLAMALARERDYVGYIVAYNWSAVLGIGVMLPIEAIDASGLLPEFLGDALRIAAGIALLVYAWFVARTALRTGGLPAAGFVAMEVMLTVLISTIADSMIH